MTTVAALAAVSSLDDPALGGARPPADRVERGHGRPVEGPHKVEDVFAVRAAPDREVVLDRDDVDPAAVEGARHPDVVLLDVAPNPVVDLGRIGRLVIGRCQGDDLAIAAGAAQVAGVRGDAAATRRIRGREGDSDRYAPEWLHPTVRSCARPVKRRGPDWPAAAPWDVDATGTPVRSTPDHLAGPEFEWPGRRVSRSRAPAAARTSRTRLAPDSIDGPAPLRGACPGASVWPSAAGHGLRLGQQCLQLELGAAALPAHQPGPRRGRPEVAPLGFDRSPRWPGRGPRT